MKKAFLNFIHQSGQKSFFLFLVVFLILLIGVTATSGFRHYDKLGLVLLSFMGTYLFLSKKNLFQKVHSDTTNFISANTLNILLFASCIILFVLDFVYLGGPPILKSFDLDTVKEFTELRGKIHQDSPTIITYLSGFNMKGLLPFALFHFLYTRKSVFYYTLLIVASFYAFSMMQKSFIISVLLPVVIYSIYSKKYGQLALLTAVLLTVIYSLTVMLNRLIDNEKPEEIKSQIHEPFAVRISKALGERVFITPGYTVSRWFEIIPAQKPYLMGDGYPFWAKMRGRKYIDYSRELFPIMKPEYAFRGLKGSVNVASFVREYSNFGYYGLILGGLMLGVFMLFLDRLFIGFPIPFISLNLFPILLISSTSILTILFSGGWFLILLLFFLFKKQYESRVDDKNLASGSKQ